MNEVAIADYPRLMYLRNYLIFSSLRFQYLQLNLI